MSYFVKLNDTSYAVAWPVAFCVVYRRVTLYVIIFLIKQNTAEKEYF